MKSIFNKLSNVSQFFRENRFIYKKPGQSPKRKNDPRWAVDSEDPDAPKKPKDPEKQAIKRRPLKSMDDFLHSKRIDEAAKAVRKGKIKPEMHDFIAKSTKRGMKPRATIAAAKPRVEKTTESREVRYKKALAHIKSKLMEMPATPTRKRMMIDLTYAVGLLADKKGGNPMKFAKAIEREIYLFAIDNSGYPAHGEPMSSSDRRKLARKHRLMGEGLDNVIDRFVGKLPSLAKRKAEMHKVRIGRINQIDFKSKAAERKTRLKAFTSDDFVQVRIGSSKYHPDKVGKTLYAYKGRNGDYYFIDGIGKKRVKIGKSDSYIEGKDFKPKDRAAYVAATKTMESNRRRRRRRKRPDPVPTPPKPAPPKSPEVIRREKKIEELEIEIGVHLEDLTENQVEKMARSILNRYPKINLDTKRGQDIIYDAVNQVAVKNYRARKEQLRRLGIKPAVLKDYVWLNNRANSKARFYIGRELGIGLNLKTAPRHWNRAHVMLSKLNRYQREIIAKKGHRLTAKEALLLKHVKAGGKFLDGKREIMPAAGREWADSRAPKNYATVPGTRGGMGVTKMAFVS